MPLRERERERERERAVWLISLFSFSLPSLSLPFLSEGDLIALRRAVTQCTALSADVTTLLRVCTHKPQIHNSQIHKSQIHKP